VGDVLSKIYLTGQNEVLERFGNSMDEPRAELRKFMRDSKAATAEVYTSKDGGL
jgi:hypothetical protein